MLPKFALCVLLTLLTTACLGSWIKRAEVIPGPWPETGPTESDVVQLDGVGGCYFFSALAVIARLDRDAIINAVGDVKDKKWPITFYLRNDTVHTFQIEEKTADQHKKMKMAETVWVAYIERAMSEWYKASELEDEITLDNGGRPFNTFKAFYGPTMAIENEVYWPKALDLARNATKWPMTFTTKKDVEKWSIPGFHDYAIHDVNSTHIILRNPWGYVIKEGEKQSDMPKGVNITDSHGTFSITLEEAQKVFEHIDCVKLDTYTKSNPQKSVEAAVASASKQMIDDQQIYDTALDPFNFKTIGARDIPKLIEDAVASVSSQMIDGQQFYDTALDPFDFKTIERRVLRTYAEGDDIATRTGTRYEIYREPSATSKNGAAAVTPVHARITQGPE